ncbi:MAG TPA: HAD family hydrolase [Usitatibacter sp.]|nr:HAD family hydrolase [Usitatibacter sp.]
MRYTAIALDYDGTIAHDGVVPPHVVDGLTRLRQTGRKLLLVTGRELEELLGIFPEIAVFDRVVAENGALLYRPDSGERKELGEPPPDELIDSLHASGIPLSVGHTIIATVRPHETTVLEAIANLGLEQQVIFNKGAVMILPPGVNKASGLKYALAELGLSPRNVVAAGDGENDHALLEMAEYSAATANAIDTLKAAADYVTRETHGDGVLEVVAGLIESDLAGMPPKRPRRVLCIGKDTEGRDVLLPTAHGSVLITGEPAATADLTTALLNRLCRTGYQFCALDTRAAYVDFKPAVVFGSSSNAPAVAEVLTALGKPDVQTVVCLAAVGAAERPRFVEKLLLPLRELRETAGRPHWIIVDEAHELLPASARPDDSPASGAENTIYVAADPMALAPGVLATVEGIVACGEQAPAMIDAFAAAAAWKRPALPTATGRRDQALVWFRRSERPVSLIEVSRMKAELPSAKPERREKSAEVGQVLRRA